VTSGVFVGCCVGFCEGFAKDFFDAAPIVIFCGDSIIVAADRSCDFRSQ
jgi:hypothetical protein